MRSMMFVLAVTATCLAQSKTASTINLDIYKNKSKYAIAETTITVKTHSYRLMNIQPLYPCDTTCISSVIIDKRKLVFFDINGKKAPRGLLVPKEQPIPGAMIVFRGSPIESRTLIFFANGKLVTLPGDMVIADPDGNMVYCVWDNDNTYQLTVFDYKRMRSVVPATNIEKPEKWYFSGMDYYFKATGSDTYYVVNTLANAVTKMDKPEAGDTPLKYIRGFESVDPVNCCGAKMWNW
jgi:hypothetical protein